MDCLERDEALLKLIISLAPTTTLSYLHPSTWRITLPGGKGVLVPPDPGSMSLPPIKGLAEAIQRALSLSAPLDLPAPLLFIKANELEVGEPEVSKLLTDELGLTANDATLIIVVLEREGQRKFLAYTYSPILSELLKSILYRPTSKDKLPECPGKEPASRKPPHKKPHRRWPPGQKRPRWRPPH